MNIAAKHNVFIGLILVSGLVLAMMFPSLRDVASVWSMSDKENAVCFGGLNDVELLARLIYGEARGESFEGKVGIGQVALNRLKDDRARWGRTWERVILKSYQFSCFNHYDVNRKKLVNPPIDKAYTVSLGIAYGTIHRYFKDNTMGATHYVSVRGRKPPWVKDMVRTVRIGNHEFYKEKRKR